MKATLISLIVGILMMSSDVVKAQVLFLPADTLAPDYVTFTTVGGTFQSYGCEGLDPTFWLSGGGIVLTANFSDPQDTPFIRVWGMNDDDIAEIKVNGTIYSLDENSAWYTDKIICSDVFPSPGPDGVVFINGQLVGANSNSDGNYSYQDVYLNTTGVNSISIEGIAGAGWGADGVGINLTPVTVAQPDFSDLGFRLYPNPAANVITLDFQGQWSKFNIQIITVQGATRIEHLMASESTTVQVDISDYPRGLYLVKVHSEFGTFSQKFLAE